eukprot:gnl/MRDRNA2_/MRDRNA2_97700_c0_seq1.p1 gnl/MRDRNA2_/MRDRNA2_97700_c0~~gnl/MRDRNA2_/MRDRNA2_97700_c0_seq1.p1  ORF type:complete len:206 (-),score=75.75 gnl/MRDRNA2_/MRDRNA2_97700_c0_seq1:198-728(-)
MLAAAQDALETATMKDGGDEDPITAVRRKSKEQFLDSATSGELGRALEASRSSSPTHRTDAPEISADHDDEAPVLQLPNSETSIAAVRRNSKDAFVASASTGGLAEALAASRSNSPSSKSEKEAEAKKAAAELEAKQKEEEEAHERSRIRRDSAKGLLDSASSGQLAKALAKSTNK